MAKLNKNQKLFFSKVVNCVATRVGPHEALKMVNQSTFLETLIEDPAFAMYHEPEYWAEEVFKRSKVAV